MIGSSWFTGKVSEMHSTRFNPEDMKVPVKYWLDPALLEEAAQIQIKNLANLPFAFRHAAIMPDSHCGYGMPIGGVLATQGVVIPYGIGLDIGCGMALTKTSLTDIDRDTLKKVLGLIRKEVPVGFAHHQKAQDDVLMPVIDNLVLDGIVDCEYGSATHQLGTLGGGNHFIEIQRGNDGYIYVMIHSGSRNLGKKVADHYNKLAKELNERWFSAVPLKADLAFLPLDTTEGKDYMTEMNYCVEFARANRSLMMKRVMESLAEFTDARVLSFWDVAHNYAAMEHHFGHNVLVHRKGATRAREGEICIIPGSQGTSSYLCEGLGNRDSFESCSHGAGRKMGRKDAVRKLDLAHEVKRLEDKGILHAIRGKEDLEEAAGAYKDIDEVMANQTDLVRVKVKLEPLAVVKG